MAIINKKRTYNIALQIIIILATYYYIYRQLRIDNLQLTILNYQLSVINCMLLLLLMLLNWGIEALKWRYLISKLENISFIRSFTAVLSGVTISTFLPNRTGEYLGRVFILDKSNRIHGILITIIGSISQMLVTVIAGLLSLIIIVRSQQTTVNSPLYSLESGLWANYIFFGISFLNLAVIGICIFIYFNITSLIGFSNRIKYLKKYRLARYLKIFSWFSNRELLKVFILSLLRYIIFTFQFYLILKFLGITLPLLQACIFISSVFFITTIIPSITFSELGVRGTVAISLFSIYLNAYAKQCASPNIKLVAATTILWLINLILPAIMGSLFIFRLRFFKKK